MTFIQTIKDYKSIIWHISKTSINMADGGKFGGKKEERAEGGEKIYIYKNYVNYYN